MNPQLVLTEPGSFAFGQRLLFAALAVLSISLFLRRLVPIVRKILQSKPDPDFSLAPVGRRVRKFLWEVLLQAKVIRQRPLPGLAHALVFWSFCAFVLVTLNHCALPFGLHLLDPASPVGCAYTLLAGFFAIACAVGILGLFVRRFVLRPQWLGELSWGSGLVALLIFVLMLTYLAAFVVRAPAAAVMALWWLHTLTLLVFLPVIPHTKHLHLLLGPFSVFFSRGSFAQIPPLSGDDDFGLVSGRDLTRIVSLQAYSCVECGRCMEQCPANATGKALNPKKIALGLRGYLNEFGPTSEEPLLGKYLSQQAVFQCTTCGACEFQCPVGVEHVPILVGLRRGAVNTGAWEDRHGNQLFLTLEKGSNALGLSPSERDKFIAKHALPIFDGSQQYCLWLGCMGAYDPAGREIVLALVRLLRHLGISFGVLRKEKCTGDAVRRLGNDLLFQQLAEANLEILAQNKVKKILSICPHCVRTMQEDWKQFGTPPEVEHHSEFLARHRAQLPQLPNAPKVVFHDPCYLGRYRNLYDQPRQVAALGGVLVEAPRSRERSFCCGAGGGLAFLGEEQGERISQQRVAELVATGASVVAAACPFCNTMFRDALAAHQANAPVLMDLAQLAAQALPHDDAGREV